jgi:hypothetical protein
MGPAPGCGRPSDAAEHEPVVGATPASPRASISKRARHARLAPTQAMVNSKRALSSTPLPATLIYATALTCGVMAAIGLQAYLNRAGYDLVSLWKNLLSPQAMQLRTAGPWWAIAGLAFIVSGLTAAALSRLPLPWRRLRLLRWAAGAAIVFLLADLGHSSAGTVRVDAGANAFASLGALAIAALMGLCGAYFTARR